jgi:hypothetical protein
MRAGRSQPVRHTRLSGPAPAQVRNRPAPTTRLRGVHPLTTGAELSHYIEQPSEQHWNQIRIQQPKFATWVPYSISFALVLVLALAIIRNNISLYTLSKYPWRIKIMDVPASATLLGIFIGLILARTQFARSVRPFLGWTGTQSGSKHLKKSKWTVHIHNGGPGPCVVHQVHYRVILPPASALSSEDSRFDQWLTFFEIVDLLMNIQLKRGKDYDLMNLTPGAPLPSLKGSGDVRPELAAFTRKTLKKLYSLDVRFCVTDISGTTYERIIRTLYRAPNK